MRWLLLFALGCQQGRAPTPAPVVRAIDAHGDAPGDAVYWCWDGPPAAPVTIDSILRGFDTDTVSPRICFAVSANHRRVACAFDMDTWEGMLSATRGVRILGDLGSATSEWTYLDTTTTPANDEGVLAAIDHAAIEDLRRALDQRHYQAFDAAGTPLSSTATVGGRTLRRTRIGTSDDTVELACRAGWVRIPLDYNLHVNETTTDDVTMRVSAFDDRRILIEIDSHVGYEGGHQSLRGAQLVDAVALCN